MCQFGKVAKVGQFALGPYLWLFLFGDSSHIAESVHKVDVTRVHYKFTHQYVYLRSTHELFICVFIKQIDLPDLFEAADMLWFHRHIAAKGLKIHCYELLVIVEPEEVSVQCNKNDMVDPCRHVVGIFSSCY